MQKAIRKEREYRKKAAEKEAEEKNEDEEDEDEEEEEFVPYELPSFKELCSTASFEFYNMDSGTNYAQDYWRTCVGRCQHVYLPVAMR